MEGVFLILGVLLVFAVCMTFYLGWFDVVLRSDRKRLRAARREAKRGVQREVQH